MSYKIYVDGQEGTTGLQILDYLSKRTDLQLLKIDSDKRKDISARKELLNDADLAFLCLPDAAAVEAVSLIDNKHTKVIDASTAHRTNRNWVYGLPELGNGQRERIAASTRVANPGCHATGFILLINPLLKMSILPKDYPVSCTSITGYSGGGRKLIAKYQQSEASQNMGSPKPYGLKLQHKHLPEMTAVSGLNFPPVFLPVVSNYYKGMAVSIPLAADRLSRKTSVKDIQKIMSDFYADEKYVNVMPYEDDSLLEDGSYLNVEACNDTNNVDIFVFGHEEQILLVARFDNLGKGASGAAVQNMNLMLGLEESLGL